MHETVITKPKLNKNFTFTLSDICIFVMLACALLTGIVPQTLLSFVALAASALLLTTNKVYLAFPIMIFYYEAFGTIAGMSVYRYYSIIFLASAIISCKGILLKRRQSLVFLVYVLYTIIVAIPINMRRGIFVIVDIVCVLMLINSFLDTEDKLKSFFKTYVYTALCAYVTGNVINATKQIDQFIDGEVVEIVRNYATFEDPNYAGFFYTIAIFSLITLKLFNPKVRAVLVVALYITIFTTLSITAILLNFAFWMIYLLVFRKLKPAAIVAIVLVVVILIGLYSYGLANPDTPVLGSFSYRVWDKLQALERNDMDGVTTNRTGLVEKHLDFFWSQSVFRMFVGMNQASVISTDLDGFKEAAHNEYVDYLLNIGFIGAAIYLGYFVLRLAESYKGLRKQDNYYGCIFMIKVIWALYGFTLTMFGDHRFMLMFLL